MFARAPQVGVRRLRLDFNGIDPHGARLLGEALARNAVLRDLSLCKNDAGRKGSLAFARALQSNATLTRLDLDANEVGGVWS